MFRDALELAEGETLAADVCIIGAGAAGITLAMELQGSGLSVILLEAGGLERDSRAQDLYRGSMSGLGGWELHRERLRQLGGSTMHWAGFCTPLTPADFEARPWIPNSGWPIGYGDVLPYYRRAQTLVQLPSFAYDGTSLASGRDPLDREGGRLSSAAYQFSPPTRFGIVYRAALEAADDVTVVLGANVTELRLVEPGVDRLDRVECAAFDGPRFSVTAGRFVLATGGIENPRLLLASNAQRPEGVGNQADLVGRYFMEHPHFYGQGTWLEPSTIADGFYRLQRVSLPNAAGDVVSVSVQGFLSLSPELRAREGLLDFAAAIRPLDFDEPDTGAIEARRARALLAGRGDAPRVNEVTLRAEQAPDPESRVTLGSDRDELGMPRVDLHWQVGDADRESLARGMRWLARELGALGAGRLHVPVDDRGRLVGRIFPGGHHMGTTRMGASEAEGVVDRDAKVFGVENLYVAGSSVFVTVGRANPTLTLVALAVRLGDHLAGRPYETEAP